MNDHLTHPWDVNPKEALIIQSRLYSYIIQKDDFSEINTIAGVDVGFYPDQQKAHAAIAMFSYPELQRIDSLMLETRIKFPYIPGLLSFREVPAIIEVLEKFIFKPDLLLCDGHGYAHPRRFGLACHLGILTGIPTIGVAKSRLIGTHQIPDRSKGDWQPLIDQEQIVGAVLRTRNDVKPVYVSIGHRISLKTAVEVVIHCSPKYRIPEPLRQAHKLASI